MKRITLTLIISFVALVGLAQSPCDSNYIRIFSKAGFDVAAIPCDQFVVIGEKYYDRISQGYNLSRGIIFGQEQVLMNLQKQLDLANAYSATLKAANDSAESTIRKFSDNNKAYEALLDKSTKANDRLVAQLSNQLNDLDKLHKKEVRKVRWRNLAAGGVIGIVIGAVGCLLLVN